MNTSTNTIFSGVLVGLVVGSSAIHNGLSEGLSPTKIKANPGRREGLLVRATQVL
jgi:hypothetical protein